MTHGTLRVRAPGGTAPHYARMLAFQASRENPLPTGANVVFNSGVGVAYFVRSKSKYTNISDKLETIFINLRRSFPFLGESQALLSSNLFLKSQLDFNTRVAMFLK